MADRNAYMCHDNAKETSHLKQKSSGSIKTDNCIQFTKCPKEIKRIPEGEKKISEKKVKKNCNLKKAIGILQARR